MGLSCFEKIQCNSVKYESFNFISPASATLVSACSGKLKLHQYRKLKSQKLLLMGMVGRLILMPLVDRTRP